jgi:hypothetical protein
LCYLNLSYICADYCTCSVTFKQLVKLCVNICIDPFCLQKVSYIGIYISFLSYSSIVFNHITFVVYLKCVYTGRNQFHHKYMKSVIKDGNLTVIFDCSFIHEHWKGCIPGDAFSQSRSAILTCG